MQGLLEFINIKSGLTKCNESKMILLPACEFEEELPNKVFFEIKRM